jgi:hypothetical protein
MSDKYPFIPEYLTKSLEDVSIPLIDLIHGYLKVEMLEAEQELTRAIEVENQSGEAMDSMERTSAEGYLEALTNVYCMTYNLSIDRQRIEESL